MTNIEKWRKEHNIPLAPISRLLQKSRGRVSNIEKGHRAVSSVEIEKIKILDQYAANFASKRQANQKNRIIHDPKLGFRLERDKIKLRKIKIALEKINEKIKALEVFFEYLTKMQDEPSIADTLEYEYEYRSTRENIEDLCLRKQYLLIDKASLSGAIAVNKRFNNPHK